MRAMIEVHELYEMEGGHEGYWAKGHHAPDGFIQAIRDEDMAERSYGEYTYLQPENVRHTCYRNEPVDSYTREELGCNHILVERIKGGRGCYPVTVLDHSPAIAGQNTLEPKR